MLVCKGQTVSFRLADGRSVDAPSNHAMMHDATGRSWGKHSVLIGPVRKTGDEADADKYARDYFGGCTVYRGGVALPPRALSDWRSLGDVEWIYYTRLGRKHRGRYRHRFNKPGLAVLVKGKGRARLYRHGSFLRLELSKGAILDSRGIVWP